MSARWYADVLPEDVAEAQRYWELVGISERMRELGLPYERRLALGILPYEYRDTARHPKSPIERYLETGQRFYFSHEIERRRELERTLSNVLTKKILDILGNPRKRAAAMRRARKSMSMLKKWRKKDEKRRRLRQSRLASAA